MTKDKIKIAASKWLNDNVDRKNTGFRVAFIDGATSEAAREYWKETLREESKQNVSDKFDFVINMWKNTDNEMDGLHTLETLKIEILDLFLKHKEESK